MNFPENALVAEIYAQALQAAGVPVRREPGLGSRELVQPALRAGTWLAEEPNARSLVDEVSTVAAAALSRVRDDHIAELVTDVLVPRFARTYWKYRRHPKAYRVIVLEAGHISQNLYLAAAELGLGAFVTAAINEADIEAAFGLDPLEESPLAVCGFGLRAAQRGEVEFDPLGAVWRES